jgi:hypothetical protein
MSSLFVPLRAFRAFVVEIQEISANTFSMRAFSVS